MISFCKWWSVARRFFLLIFIYTILIQTSISVINGKELAVYAKDKADNISIVNTRSSIKYAEEEDRITSQGQWPWNAVIFMYDHSGYWKNICLGTIISPHIIITAAQCVYDASTYKAMNPTFFRVGVGNLSHSDSDSSTRLLQVSSIHISDDYVGAITGHEQNIALVGLSNDIKFNDTVRPVYLDWDGKKSFTNSSLAMIAGWDDLKQTDSNRKIHVEIVQYISRKSCVKSYLGSPYLRYLSFDQFCLLSNKDIKDEDMGAGVVVAIEGTSYLKGILGANIKSEFLIATNTSKHLSWIKGKVAAIDGEMRCIVGFLCSNKCIEMEKKCNGFKDCEDGSDESYINCGKKTVNETCILPSQKEGATYKLLICDKSDEKCIRKPLQSVRYYTKVRVICGIGYASPIDKTDLAICTPEGWFPEDPQCIKLCPSLEKKNTDINCTFQGSPITCKEFVRPGSIAKYNCRWPYKINNSLDYTEYSECLSSGEWSGQLPDCISECGLVHFNKPLSENSSNIWEGKYPWHVGLYRTKNNNSIYQYICGGAIITPLTILTAAHCLGPSTFDSKLYSVGAGKIISDWDFSEPHQQYRFIKRATLPDLYTSSEQEHDIAIIDVQSPFIINYYVSPVCVDWHKNAIPSGAYGTISSWGYDFHDNNHKKNSKLQEVVVATISIKECRDKFRQISQYLSYDKFCGLIGPRLGSSGSSMTFAKDDFHYAYGIISVTPHKGMIALTNITNHLDMIKNHLESQPDD